MDLDWIIGSILGAAGLFLISYLKGRKDGKAKKPPNGPWYTVPFSYKEEDVTITDKEKKEIHDDIQKDSFDHIADVFNRRYPNSKRKRKN